MVKEKSQVFSEKILNISHFISPKAEFLLQKFCNLKSERTQGACGLKVPTESVFSIRKNPDGAKNYEIARERWAWLRKKMYLNEVSDEDLKKACKQIIQHTRIFQYGDDGEKKRIFTCNSKGTNRYATKQKFKIMDFVDAHIKAGWQCYFLTLTCDIKKYGNKYFAWKEYYTNEIHPVLENERKHHKLEYVYVLESTAKGLPHAHIMLFYPPKFDIVWDKMKNNTVVKFGRVFNAVQKYKNSRISYLKVVKGDKVKYYLTKYLTKSSEFNLPELAKKTEPYTKEEKKMLQELIFTKAVNVRGVSFCKSRIETEPPARAERAGVGVSFSGVSPRRVSTSRALRAYLNGLCINSPFNCAKCLQSLSLNKFFENFGSPPKPSEEFSQENAKIFKFLGRKINCEGCFWSEFQKLILNPESSRLNKKYYDEWSANIFHYWSDDYDLDDDESFIAFLDEIICYYLDGILNRGMTLSQLCEENITNYFEENEKFESSKTGYAVSQIYEANAEIIELNLNKKMNKREIFIKLFIYEGNRKYYDEFSCKEIGVEASFKEELKFNDTFEFLQNVKKYMENEGHNRAGLKVLYQIHSDGEREVLEII